MHIQTMLRGHSQMTSPTYEGGKGLPKGDITIIVHQAGPFAKLYPIFKSRTVLESLDQFKSNSFLPFSSKVGLKGREIDVKFCTTQKRTLLAYIFCFRSKMLALYRKIELLELFTLLFWGNAKIGPFSTEFRDPLDPFQKKIIQMTLIEFYPSFPKLFEISKSDKLQQNA